MPFDTWFRRESASSPSSAAMSMAGNRTQRPAGRPSRRGDSGAEHRAGNEVGTEGGEDREVEEAGRGHHRGVVPLTQRGPGHADEADREERAADPDPPEHT